MSSFLRACERLVLTGLAVAFAINVAGQNSYAPLALEYLPVGALPGDQVNPSVAMGPAGGFLVWEDNLTDGDGTAIVAQRLSPNGTGLYGSFRVNQQGARDQQKPQVALLKNGGAVVVWQGNQAGNWDIYAAFLNSNGTFAASDVLVNTFTNADQITPAVACLEDGNVMIAWGSFASDADLQEVCARRFTPQGLPLDQEFRVNTSVKYNQRTPVLAAVAGGNCVVAWVSEHLSTSIQSQAGIYAQVLSPAGLPVGGEFAVCTTTSNICANPAVTAFAAGGYLVAWGQKGVVDKTADVNAPENSWDIFCRIFTAGNKPVQRLAARVNTFTYGEQYAPRVASLGSDALVVWTSLGQDGSREGVFGQFLSSSGSWLGSEMRVNTTLISQQIHPVVAADAQNTFLVAWTSFAGLDYSFDLNAQRYERVLAPLSAPAAPYVSALSQSKLSITWPALEGFTVTAYEVYVDDAPTPVLVTSNSYVAAGLVAASSHAIQLAYRLADGRISPKSNPASATTWGTDDNFDGLPDDWQAQFFGTTAASWPAANVDSDGDGVSNKDEFLAGTNPADPKSVLKISIATSPQGVRLNWNTQAGSIYQVQFASQLGQWTSWGAPRLAASSADSIAVDGMPSGCFFRVLRVR